MLVVVRDVNTCSVAGDDILVTSTDFDWRQAEVKKMVECPDCAPNQIRLDCEWIDVATLRLLPLLLLFVFLYSSVIDWAQSTN